MPRFVTRRSVAPQTVGCVPASVLGCRMLFAHFGGMGNNRATDGAPGTVRGAGIATRPSAYGVATYAAASTAGLSWADIATADGSDYTIVAVVNYNAGRVAAGVILSADNFNIAGMRRNWMFRADESNGVEFIPFDAGIVDRHAYGPAAIPANTPTVVAARVQRRVSTAWVAGVSGSADTASSNLRGIPRGDYLTVANFGNMASYPLPYYGDIVGVWLLAGALPDDAMRSLRRPEDAFALLTTPRVLRFGAAAAPSLPTLSLPTYKPGTLTSGGFQPRVTAS